jgi:hypothetical protein
MASFLGTPLEPDTYKRFFFTYSLWRVGGEVVKYIDTNRKNIKGSRYISFDASITHELLGSQIEQLSPAKSPTTTSEQ